MPAARTAERSLCPAFRAAAAGVQDLMARGRLLALTPWETSLTDMLLLSVASGYPGRVVAERFDAVREAPSGADWQWWFRDGDRYAGMRVQAKRRHPRTGTLSVKQRASGPPDELQAERLVRVAARDGLTAFYCFYSDRVPSGAAAASTGPCPHGPVDTAQWGVSMLLGRSVVRLAQARRLSSEKLAAAAWPWWAMVCESQYSRGRASVVETVGHFIEQAAWAELSVLQEAGVLDDPGDGVPWQDVAGPATGSEPPQHVVRAFERGSAAEAARTAEANIALFDQVPAR
jgi:hypothetical protein